MNPFPHQLTGATFINSRPASILADEPGLAKTATRIMSMVTGPYAKETWAIEAEAKTHGHWKQQLRQWAPGKTDYLLFNIESRRKVDRAKLFRCKELTVDEGHRYKNVRGKYFEWMFPFTQTPGVRVVPMTGTPIYSYPVDYFALLCMVKACQLYHYGAYVSKYCNPQRRRTGGHRYIDVRGGANLAELNQLAAPVVCRRTWQEVGIEMPPITFTDVAVDVDPGGDYIKASADWGAWYKTNHGKKAPPLSKFVSLRRILANAKVAAVAESLANDLCNPIKILVFSEFREPVERLYKKFPQNGFLCLGGQSQKQIDAKKAAFIAAAPPAVMFATTKSMGLGVDGLQVANRAHFVDLGFESATFDQAWRRVWRLGSKNAVSIVRYHVEGDAMENFIMKNLTKKEGFQRQLGVESSASLSTLRG